MNEALMSVMRLSGFGRTGSGQCSRQKSERKDQLQWEAMPQWRWHLDEVFARINGNIHYLWRQWITRERFLRLSSQRSVIGGLQ